MTYNTHPFQLLEINVISAQDLAPVSKSMKTYAVVWVHPERKLSTKVDQGGNTNPQWNEKFVFRVDDTFLNADSSAVMIEIYAAAWLRDVQIGSVRVLISNLFPSGAGNHHHGGGGGNGNGNAKMRFVALQIRRPSGRPQGILNMGVQLLDNTMRSMPLYTELSASGIGFNDLIDAKAGGGGGGGGAKNLEEKTAKLRRTKSDRTDLTSTDNDGSSVVRTRKYGGSSCVGPVTGGGSLVSSSVMPARKDQHGGGGGGSHININNNNHHHHSNGNGNGSMVNGGSQCSDVGPSASVVAAAIAKGLIKTPAGNNAHGDAGSSVLEDWTENDSVEGLRTKLERWRTELPPIYDTDVKKMQSKSRRKGNHQRRKSEGTRLFSCFGNACGCEITITCGGGGKKKKNGGGSATNKHGGRTHSSSVDSQSYF